MIQVVLTWWVMQVRRKRGRDYFSLYLGSDNYYIIFVYVRCLCDWMAMSLLVYNNNMFWNCAIYFLKLHIYKSKFSLKSYHDIPKNQPHTIGLLLRAQLNSHSVKQCKISQKLPLYEFKLVLIYATKPYSLVYSNGSLRLSINEK